MLTLFFAAPFVLPIPLPGLSVLLGVIIAALGVFIFLQRPPVVPKSWSDRKLDSQLVKRIIGIAVRCLEKVEGAFRPREFLPFTSFKRFNGLLISTLALFLALPLPPGTNFPPGIGIITLSLAALERDEVLMLAGYFIFCLNVAFFTGIAIFGFEGVQFALRYLNDISA